MGDSIPEPPPKPDHLFPSTRLFHSAQYMKGKRCSSRDPAFIKCQIKSESVHPSFQHSHQNYEEANDIQMEIMRFWQVVLVILLGDSTGGRYTRTEQIFQKVAIFDDNPAENISGTRRFQW